MLKTQETVKNQDHLAVDAIRELLDGVPGVEIQSVGDDRKISLQYGFGGVIGFSHDRNDYMLVIETKSSGAPRFVRSGVLQLESNTRRFQQSSDAGAGRRLIPILVSPYLSPDSRNICVENNIAYLDLVGNARIVFDNVYIERSVAEKPAAETRSLRSVFTPKAATILRVLLSEPDRPWRVAELSAKTGVSFGHVSNVRKALLEREWAETRKDGIVLAKPGKVLDAWRGHYRASDARTIVGYTHLHGTELEKQLQGVLNSDSSRPRAIFSKHSAARWLAPFGRTATQSFYVDDPGIEAVKDALALAPAGRGANVVLQVPTDECLFDDPSEPAPGVLCTSPVVTYLDLWNGTGRDREAAEHLAGEFFPWLR